MRKKFKVGDVIRRKPLAAYNYEQPVMKIAKISGNLYIFEQEPMALEIVAQDEWELYDKWYKRAWESVKGFLKWLFRYHQPKKRPLKHIGRQKRVPGLHVWSYNKVTKVIKDAEFVSGKVIMEPDCVYRQALNKKNFIKKLKREGIIKSSNNYEK